MTDSKIIYTHTDEAPAAGDVLVPADHPGVRLDRRRHRRDPRHLAGRPHHRQLPRPPRAPTSASTTPSPSSASWPRRPRPTSSSCRTSPPRSRSSRRRSPSCRRRATTLPDYPDDPTDRRGAGRPRPLRQGQGQRRQPGAARGQLRPPRARLGEELRPQRTRTRMGAWSPDSKTNVAHMAADDFRSTEKSAVDRRRRLAAHRAASATTARTTVLRESVPVLAGEVVDATVMRVAALREFLTAQIARAKAEGVLFSVHLKATMMKVSDPIIFGHAVRAFFPKLFAEYGDALAAAGLQPERRPRRASSSGLESLPRRRRDQGRLRRRSSPTAPRWRWSTPTSGITNLHVPSDVIVDASMPAMIRTSGHMWGPDGKEADTLAVIPDSSYAGIYQVVIDDCRANGAFDPATMGSVPNVGLMAQAAEEYGSHDKTFEIAADRHGPRRRRRRRRRCSSTRSAPATSGACARPRTCRSATGSSSPSPAPAPPATRRCSGSTRTRAHDANLIAKVETYLPEHDTDGPADRDHVARSTRPRSRSSASAGRGHHLGHRQRAARLPHRPVPDPGARHQRQDALDRPADQRRRPVRDRRRRLGAQARAAAGQGELPALGQPRRVPRAGGELRAPGADHRQRPRPDPRRHARPGHRHASSNENKSPSRKVGEIDNRGSHFYLALYWAEELAAQTDDAELAAAFAALAKTLREQRGRRSSPSCSPCRARRPTSAATTAPTPTRPTPSCARRRR